MVPQLPLANTITLGVQDFSRNAPFTRRDWPVVFDSNDFCVFGLRGALLALFPLDQLARDAQADASPAKAGIRSAMIINLDRPEEVDEFAARASGRRDPHQADHRR